ncbi:dolichol-phosphate mannosyltransferase subunit 3, putative [Plasmodium malariae]|uniref:Dolichol-phosphate mannosyltransferase subunit 3 n=1 Tax=Plasmodium malariae TaxID=5858 RepID=A0A1C3KDA3_PLAMA|nr:dolichol-phosphate mannosyltransferase subunit 3, putative [Plasmodium malariae]
MIMPQLRSAFFLSHDIIHATFNNKIMRISSLIYYTFTYIYIYVHKYLYTYRYFFFISFMHIFTNLHYYFRKCIFRHKKYIHIYINIYVFFFFDLQIPMYLVGLLSAYAIVSISISLYNFNNVPNGHEALLDEINNIKKELEKKKFTFS